jgi:hypothetical protein
MMKTKYQVGDVLLVKKCEYKSRLLPHPRLPPRLRLRPHLRLKNTVGIITEVEKHSDIFESGSTESDNGYIWLSQIDGKEYHFFENEIECEVLK